MHSKAIPLPRNLILAIAAFLGSVGSSAAAQSPVGESVFVNLGQWSITTDTRAYNRQGTRSCTLRHAAPNGIRLTMVKSGARPASLSVQTVSSSVFVGEITFAFDDDEFVGRPAGNRLFAPVETNTEIEGAFRRSQSLSVRQDGATLAFVSLKNSSAAFRLLKQCAEQGQLGVARTRREEPSAMPARRAAASAPTSTPPTAANAPPRTAQRSASTAPSLARGPIPITPGTWVRNSDPIRLPSQGGGTLRFTLVVNPQGRAEECVVDQSTGARSLDEQLCRLLQRRARFEPANDANGRATTGRFSSSIQYDVAP